MEPEESDLEVEFKLRKKDGKKGKSNANTVLTVIKICSAIASIVLSIAMLLRLFHVIA